MKTYKYEQFLCCSSEKSLSSGYPGFGVRAKSPGITIEEADRIYGLASLHYGLPYEMSLTDTVLRANPQLDKLYPHRYISRAITLDDGSVRYVVARVMLVGGEYGFFDYSDTNNRVGSNNIGHALVFDAPPPVEVVAQAIKQSKFLPVNTLCSFDNAEFKRILKGEPYALSAGEITVGDSPYKPDALAGYLLIALLQDYKNRKEDSDVRGVIVKVPTDEVTRVIDSIAHLAPKLVDKLYFNANLIGQSSVSDDLRMIIVNEKDPTETSDDYSITVDARHNDIKLKNIDNNYIFERILQAAASADITRMNLAAELYMQICTDKDADYEQAYRLLVLSTTDDPITIDDVAALNLKLAADASLPEPEKQRVWLKINEALQSAFVFSDTCTPKKIKLGLDLSAKIYEVAPGRLEFRKSQADFLQYILFDSNKYFAQILDGQSTRRRIAIKIFDAVHAPKPEEDAFYLSLLTSSDIDEWRDFLAYYYGGDWQQHFATIVGQILDSDNKDKQSLATELFPVSQYTERWVDFVNDNPTFYGIVGTYVGKMFVDMVKRSPQQEIDNIFQLNPDLIKQLPLSELCRAYTAAVTERPSTIDFPRLSYTYTVLNEYGTDATPLLRVLDIHDEKPVKAPTLDDLKLAIEVRCSTGYIHDLFDLWIKTNPKATDIVAFISKISTSADSTARFLDSVWAVSAKRDAGETFIYVTDNVSLMRHSIKEVIPKLKSKEAQDTLQAQSGFFKKFSRKVIGIIKGGPKCLLILLPLLLLTACSDDDTVYVNPLCAVNFGDPIGTEEIISTEYNKKGKPVKVSIRRYDVHGNLIYESYDDQKGNIDSTVYVYDDKQRLIDIRHHQLPLQGVEYNDLNQLTKLQRTIKGTPDTVHFTFAYNPDNTLHNILIQVNPNTPAKSITHDFAGGRLIKVTESEGENFSVREYNPANNHLEKLTTFEHKGGNIKKNSQKVTTYTYTDSTSSEPLKYQEKVTIKDERGRKQGSYIIEHISYDPEVLDPMGVLTQDEGRNLAQPAAPIAQDSTIVADGASGEVIPYAIEEPDPHRASMNALQRYIHDVKVRYAVNNARTAAPGGWLLLIVLAITAGFIAIYTILAKRARWFQPFKGKPTSNGMYRLWMFNYEPYLDVVLVLGIVLAAFITSIVLLMTIGGLTWLLLWLVKIILLILIWGGIAALVIGGFMVIFGDGDSKSIGCLPLIFGGLIVAFQDSLRQAGDALVEWGFNFWDKISMFRWGLSLFTNFWDVILLCLAIPLGIFLAACIAVILIVFLLTAIEWCIMRIYGIRRPCPECGDTKDKEYWVDNRHKHPVRLRPGIYGVFTHRNPTTKQSLPTMLFFGKDKLMRKCGKCGIMIGANKGAEGYGTERHIGVVGNTSCGKSWLIYTVLHHILEMYGDRVHQTDTQKGGASAIETDIETRYREIQSSGGGSTVDLPSYHAIQLILKQKLRGMPWHLFFYDVAGEKFNVQSTTSKTAMDFYSNIDEVVFVIDPARVDYSLAECSGELQKWVNSNQSGRPYDMTNTLGTLRSILERVGRNTKDINLIFVLVKSDLGYAKACGYDPNISGDMVKKFMIDEMHLSSLITAATSTFRNVDFDMTSTMPTYRSTIDSLTKKILQNVGIR